MATVQEEIFTHVLSVDPLRTFKPDPAVYQLSPRHLGVPKDDIVFGSANTFDILRPRPRPRVSGRLDQLHSGAPR
ncbi:hypothetical protein NKDENANG_03876 [Candidatus Entotheonellaceae bacterium PAL068K]